MTCRPKNVSTGKILLAVLVFIVSRTHAAGVTRPHVERDNLPRGLLRHFLFKYQAVVV